MKKNKILKSIMGFLFMGLCIILFFVSPGLLILLLFLIIPGLNLIKHFHGENFVNKQRALPTSKILSVPMGEAELAGEAIPAELIKAPLGGDCIGYRYKIEKISTDDEGRDSYTTIHDEVVCKPFTLKDETGTIAVNPEAIEFFLMKQDKSRRSNRKRYSQYLIMPNTKYILLGEVGLKDNEPIMQKGSAKVFTIGNFSNVEMYNRYRPMLNQLVNWLCLLGFLISLLLLSPLKYEEGRLFMDWENFSFMPDFNLAF